jgi:hypothetical protein
LNSPKVTITIEAANMPSVRLNFQAWSGIRQLRAKKLPASIGRINSDTMIAPITIGDMPPGALVGVPLPSAPALPAGGCAASPG